MRLDETRPGSWLRIVLALWMVPVCGEAQDAAKFFETSCAVCHTIGNGPRVGPDLQGVTERRDRDWLIEFLRNPEAVLNSGDPYARQLLEAARGMIMPTFPEMTPELASALLDLIDAKSQPPKPESAPPEPPPSAAKSPPSEAPDAAKFFETSCAVCHTIGSGPRSGPDLQGVTQRRDRNWLIKFLRNPEAVLNSGDPYAKQLLEAARGMVMPTFPEMTPKLASALLDFIDAKQQPPKPDSKPPEPQPGEAESKRSEPESQPPEASAEVAEITDRPFTPQDVEQGKRIFSGARPLAHGAPACFSCHAIRGFGGLGGGRLAPDLTRVYERLRGRGSLAAWLGAPPTTEMRALFDSRPLEPEEIALLVAYFEDSAKRGGEAESSVILGFFFLGLGGTIVALISFDSVWKRRLRGVREVLVRGAGLKR